MPKHNKHQVSLQETYNHYKENVDKPLDYKTHKKVLDAFGKHTRIALVEGKDVKLFEGLATLQIRKIIKRTFVDKKASKEAGRTIRGNNSHSGNYVARVFWKRHYTTFSSSGWSFYTAKSLQKMISDVMSMLGGHTRYLQKAQVARSEGQAKSMFNKKVIGI